MPVRRTKKKARRSEPYKLRGSTGMASALVSPAAPMWPSMSTQASLNHNWHASTYQHPYQQSQMVSSAEFSQALLADPGLSIQSIETQSHSQRPASHTHTHSHSHSLSNEGPWTADMDSTLMDAHARGLKWEQISQQFFPNKSANACRKRYGRAKEERRATNWDESRVSAVVNAYNRDGVREQMWSLLARETGERWQDLEKLCFSQGISKMIRARPGHTRTRSRVSSGHTLDESRYPSSAEEYDHHDDSGIGLGLVNSVHHSSALPGPPVSVSSAPLDQLLPMSNYHNFSS